MTDNRQKQRPDCNAERMAFQYEDRVSFRFITQHLTNCNIPGYDMKYLSHYKVVVTNTLSKSCQFASRHISMNLSLWQPG